MRSSAPKGAAIFGEKSPSYCTRLSWLARKFPEARFIIVRRDLRDIHGSVRDAARTDRWFARTGTFCRMLRQQDALIHGCRKLEKRGFPLHYVDYSDLVGDTEKTMRDACRFLGIEFESRMTTLEGADFSPIYDAPHHRHLRGLDIRVRKKAEVGAPGLQARIARFQARCTRLSQRASTGENATEPSFAERVFFQAAGIFFLTVDLAVRWIYEAAPVGLLVRYRAFKRRFRDYAVSAPAPSTAGPAVTAALGSENPRP